METHTEALLRQHVADLEAKLKVQRLQIQKEINLLTFERNQAIGRAEKAEQRVRNLEQQQKSSSKTRGPYKSLSELNNRDHRKVRAEEIQKQLGPAYKIAKIDGTAGFSNLNFLAFQRVYRLPTRTVNALSKIPKSRWPTARQLEWAEKKVY